MKRQRVDNKVERRLLTAMITSTEFLSQAAYSLQPDMIEASHFRTVAQWCMDHFDQYRKAPGKDIEATYQLWAEDQEESPEADAIHDLLEDLSKSWEESPEPINVPYLLDQLRWLLDRRSLTKLQDHVDYALSTGRPEDAWEAIADCRPTDTLSNTGLDPLRDEDVWERAFSQSSEPLFHFPGDAGTFLNRALVRDGLIGIQGPEKRGKTFWCIEFVMRALNERRKAAFFQVGDLSEAQVMIRIGTYLSGRPSSKRYCGDVMVPAEVFPPRKKDKEDGEKKEVETRVTSKTYKHPITKQSCIRAAKRFLLSRGIHPERPYLKVSVHPNSSINVRGISAVLARWEVMEGFIPDVIVIDYADILAPEDPRAQSRDAVNDTWKALRRLSQERHCLVIVPTQADAASYDTVTQSMKNFSEDKRKLAHVTGMLGLNQTEGEKGKSVMRLNWIVLRESPFRSHQVLWVGQCIEIGRAFWCATF